ncbi:hypothetical protein E8D34_00285 [Nocardioides sp. GY 10113]|uniref:hypothetical protein n=1 Tax=Nocardioides sp. GY 10113 TaxID=2569761 RepID=UPI0010A878C9|nr:hypothetical protein [Nocardioides sp. GY 10113]TIC89001.1 hypothetical protein E8D34_00285 [Nocardioides sp. GY 10113]
MTHPRDRDAVAPLHPDRDDAVRRLLADAAEPAVLPDEVAASLDARLLQLTAERSAGASIERDVHGHGHGDVRGEIDQAGRRRRFLGRILVAAAAAAAVVGIGLQLHGDQPASDVMSAIADRDAQRGGEESLAEGGAPDRTEAGGRADLDEWDTAAVSPLDAADQLDDGSAADAPRAAVTERAGTSGSLAARKAVTGRVVRPAHLRTDLLRLRAAHVPASADYAVPSVSTPRRFTCATLQLDPAVYVGVHYQRLPALAVFRKPVGSTQVVEVLRCGTGETLRSVTLPTDQ